MKKWEYMGITRGQDWITIKKTTGESEMIDLKKKRKDINKVEMDLLGDLGLQGWEIAGCGNTSEWTHIVYFKRPIEG